MLSICNDTVHYCENKCTVLFYSASNTELQCILHNANFVRTYCNTFEKLFYNKQLPTCCKIAHSQKMLLH